MGAVPAGSLCKWTNPECSCLYPLGEPRRRCAEPPPWKTPALAEAPRALSAVCYAGRPGVEDTIPRDRARSAYGRAKVVSSIVSGEDRLGT